MWWWGGAECNVVGFMHISIKYVRQTNIVWRKWCHLACFMTSALDLRTKQVKGNNSLYTGSKWVTRLQGCQVYWDLGGLNVWIEYNIEGCESTMLASVLSLRQQHKLYASLRNTHNLQSDLCVLHGNLKIFFHFSLLKSDFYATAIINSVRLTWGFTWEKFVCLTHHGILLLSSNQAIYVKQMSLYVLFEYPPMYTYIPCVFWGDLNNFFCNAVWHFLVQVD